MPPKSQLTKLTTTELERTGALARLPKPKASMPRKSTSAAAARKSMKKWLESQRPPKAPKTVEKTIHGVRLKASHLANLAAIHDSGAPTAEFVARKQQPQEFLGELYSALTTYEYTKMQAEYKKRSRAARTPTARAKLAEQWEKVVEAGGRAFAAGGVKNVTSSTLDGFSKELLRSKSNFSAIVDIANSASAASSSTSLTATTKVTGGFVPQVAVLPDLDSIVIPFPIDICDEPLLDGKFTKHFSKSFSLKVSLKVWCPTWSNPFKTCTKTFTVAGASFSLDLEVGYSVTCCGASAWGLASAKACVTVVGIEVCASCTAKVTGVAGVTRSGSGSSCSYGLGVNAELKCELAGITVFSASAPFGWTLTGPCPPKILPC